MNCREGMEWIARRLEGTLPESQSRELDAHLSRCARCRAEILLQTRIHEALSRELPATLPADFAQRVTHRVEARARAERRTQRLANLVPVLAFATGALLLFVFRSDLARVLPAMVEPVSRVFGAPLVWLANTALAFLAHLADLPREQIPVVEMITRPLALTLATVAVGCVPAIWAFYRIFAFLRE